MPVSIYVTVPNNGRFMSTGWCLTIFTSEFIESIQKMQKT